MQAYVEPVEASLSAAGEASPAKGQEAKPPGAGFRDAEALTYPIFPLRISEKGLFKWRKLWYNTLRLRE